MADIHTKKITSKGEKLSGFDKDMIIKATFCKDSGKLISDLCKKDSRGSRSNTGYFTRDTLPTEKCDVHIEVKWCKTCNAPAHAYCPADSVTTRIMLNVDRSMIPENFASMPTDTEYVYNPLHTCMCHFNPDYIPPYPENPEGSDDTEGTDPNPEQ